MKVARARAAALSVRFEATRAMVAAVIKSKRDVFTAREVADLYQLGLERELGAALAGYFDPAPDHDGLRRTHCIFAESYRIACRLPHDQVCPPPAEWERLAGAGWSAKDINAVRLMIKTMCHPRHISGDLIRERLDEFGLQAGPNMERDARAHILRARLEAQERAGHFLIPAVQAAADPIAALMRERPGSMLATLRVAASAASPASPMAQHPGIVASAAHVASSSSAASAPLPELASSTAGASQRYLEHDPRPFSQMIEEVVDELIDDGT